MQRHCRVSLFIGNNNGWEKMTLRHILFAVIIAVLPTQCFAATEYKISQNQDCLARDGTGNDNTVHFCGHTNNTSCAGVKFGNEKKTYMHGESVSFNGARYWCCNGNESRLGKFKMGDKWQDETKYELITKQLDIGTCQFKRYTNICDQIQDEDCSIPDACPDGYVLQNNQCTTCPNGYVWRNKQCIKLCASGQGFASTTSTNCIACNSFTNYVDDNGVCQRCNDGWVWSADSRRCENISNMLQVTTTAHNACWLCPTSCSLYECLKEATRHGQITRPDLQAACSLAGTGAENIQCTTSNSTQTNANNDTQTSANSDNNTSNNDYNTVSTSARPDDLSTSLSGAKASAQLAGGENKIASGSANTTASASNVYHTTLPSAFDIRMHLNKKTEAKSSLQHNYNRYSNISIGNLSKQDCTQIINDYTYIRNNKDLFNVSIQKNSACDTFKTLNNNTAVCIITNAKNCIQEMGTLINKIK